MRKRGVGLLLILTFIIGAGTVLQDFRFDNSIDRERASGLALDRAFGSMTEQLADLRAGQAGYVASGQGPAFWMTRVSELLADISTALSTQRTATTTVEARSRYESAGAALADLEAIDKRARGSLSQGDKLIASDLLFQDSRDAANKLAGEISAVRALELQASETRIERLSRLRFAMNATAIGFVLLVAMFLGRSAPAAQAKPEPTTLQMLRDLPPPVKTAPVAPPAPPAPAPVRMINLAAAADLCVDLARVIDGQDVPALVERAANVLEAKGVVLWVSDATGTRLHPSIAHGYPDKILAKLAPLQIDSDNVTSLAFRSMKPQVMSSTTVGASGAIAAPLITSSGCVGVLAAEIRQNKPGADVLPVASIIAAQLAALVVPGAAAEQAMGTG
jgi:hypothetical protein